MKKNNIRSFWFALIGVASISAFVFLNTVKINSNNSIGINCNQSISEKELDEEVNSKNSGISLPGIEAVKTVLTIVAKIVKIP